MRTSPALLLAALAGCSYGWDIGAPAGSGGSGGTSASAGTTSSAASTGSAASTSATSTSTSSSSGTGPNCASLVADLSSARKAAKACTLGTPGQCLTSITDECGCASYVTQGGSAAATAFSDAVQKVKSASCSVSCAMCLPSAGACLLNAGMGPYCTP